MSDTKTDKKTESINALKNANKHLADLFADMNKKDIVLQTCANDLASVARQVGDIRVEVWTGSNKGTPTLKAFLEAMVANLNGARS